MHNESRFVELSQDSWRSGFREIHLLCQAKPRNCRGFCIVMRKVSRKEACWALHCREFFHPSRLTPFHILPFLGLFKQSVMPVQCPFQVWFCGSATEQLSLIVMTLFWSQLDQRRRIAV